MKKVLSLSLATFLVVSTLPSTLFAATVGSGEVTNVTPPDYSKNVNRNTLLEAVIKDPNASTLKTVEFMEGFTYDYSSGDNLSSFYGTSETDPLNSTTVGTAFSSADKQTAALPDQKYAVTNGKGTYPFHRFEVDVSKHLASGNDIELHWQGKTLAAGKLILSAWDYSAKKWIVLEEKSATSANDVILFSKIITNSNFYQNGKLQAMVHDASPAPLPGESASNEKFTMLWFTDTQFYAQDRPEVWESMTTYMINEYNNGRVKYVINTGDLVHLSTSQKQWAVANENLNRMDAAGIPYGVLAGNRDIINQNTFVRDFTNYYTYAGANRFKGKHWYGENMDNNRNHFDLMTFNGHKFIILYLSHGTAQDDDTVKWANDMLKKHSEKNAILAMHEYLAPKGFGTGIDEDIFARIVTPNENVKMVLSGHYTGANNRVKEVTNSDGSTRKVVEVLSNYQNFEEAKGYLRLMTFDPATDTVDFDTYSPYLNDYNFFEDSNEDFTRPYEFAENEPVTSPAIRQISTDYAAVNVYTDNSIGSLSNLASGSKASVEWNKLNATTQYFWYLNITNSSGQTKTSKIYRFNTNDAAIPEPPEPAKPTFPDIIGTKYEWALEEIEAMVERGIIAGHEDGTFKPGESIQRQHVALMFTRAIDLNKVVARTPFTDVPKSLKYYNEIMAVQEAGIIEGYQNKFYPYGKMTRAEMAKVLVVAFDIDESGTHPFTDIPSNHWAAKYIGPLYAAGITDGVSKTKFDLNKEVNRAEFATFMDRALNYKEGDQQ